MLVGNHQSHRAAGGWSARFLGVTSAIALATAIGAVTPQPASAFTCDSVTNPAGGNSGANDTGSVSSTDNTACGNFATATGNQNSSAFGSSAVANGNHATAIGAESDATSLDSTAVGYFANANSSGATAIGGGGGAGAAANASGEFSVAIGGGDAVGEGANTGADNAIAVGRGSDATGVNSIAAGFNAQAANNNSTAIGTGAETTADNQMMFGTASETYATPGITSVGSRSAQSGPLQVVTSDANGHLASDGGAVFRQLDQLQSNDTQIFRELDKLNGVDKQLRSDIDTVESGVAVAMSAVGPDLVGAERFGLSLNWGGFEGASAIGGGATAVVGRWNSSRLAVTGGIGVGLDDNAVGGRAGGQWTW